MVLGSWYMGPASPVSADEESFVTGLAVPDDELHVKTNEGRVKLKCEELTSTPS